MSHCIMSLVIEGAASQHMAGKHNTRNFRGHSKLPIDTVWVVHSNYIRRMHGRHDENIMNVGTAWRPIYPCGGNSEEQMGNFHITSKLGSC